MIDATLLSYEFTIVNMHQSHLKFWIKSFENFCVTILTIVNKLYQTTNIKQRGTLIRETVISNSLRKQPNMGMAV